MTQLQRGLVVIVVGVAATAAIVWAPRTPAPTHAPPAPQYPEVTAAILARVDTNGDGVVDVQEFAPIAAVGEPLSLYDQDGNGTLSAIEVEQSFLQTPPLSIRLPGAIPGGAPGASPGAATGGQPGMGQPRPGP